MPYVATAPGFGLSAAIAKVQQLSARDLSAGTPPKGPPSKNSIPCAQGSMRERGRAGCALDRGLGARETSMLSVLREGNEGTGAPQSDLPVPLLSVSRTC